MRPSPHEQTVRVRPLEALDPISAVLTAHARGWRLAVSTAGTTTTPRTIVRSTQSWWSSFPAYSEFSEVERGARVWVPGPLRATMNLFAAVHATVAGAILVDRAGDATHACVTPTVLERRSGELRRGTRVVVAGATFSSVHHEQARAAGLQARSYYGAAELSFVAAGQHAEDLTAFPGVDIEIRGGTIWVSSPYVADGLDTWATVGDLGLLDGDRLVVLGRPGAVTTGGATVALAPIEDVLRRHARGEVAVVGVPHPALGELIVAAITHQQDAAALAEVARAQLPRTHRPRVWHHVDAFPLTPAGKTDRRALVAALPKRSGT